VQQIGRYEIESELTRGGLSATFRARDSAGGVVAVRIVDIAALEDKSEQKELRIALGRCAKALAGFRHHHVVPVREVLEERDFVYLVSDFVEAPRLTNAIPAGRAMPTGTTIQWLQQLASALDKAHQQGLIHGALWPNNIFIENASASGTKDAEPLLRICDFEVARLVAKYSPHLDPREEAQRFLSPEQIKEADVTGRADQFALGVLSYLLVTGSRPFDAEHLPTLYYRICKEEPRPAQELATTLNEGASEVLARALAKSPAQRFSSCLEFVNALAEACGVAAGASERAERPAVRTGAPVPQHQTDRTPPELELPPQPRSGERAYLVPEKKRSGRKLALAFVFGILIGAGVWLNRYWKPSSPVPVQVADPTLSPSSPPPEAATTAPPKEGLDLKAGNSAANEEAPSAKQKPEDIPKVSGETVPNGSRASPAASSLPSALPKKQNNPAVKRQEDIAGSDEPRSSRGPTDVQLVTDPVGARIVVDDDGSSACVAPCTMNLGPGRHTLTATIAGSVTARRIFSVPADKVITVVLTRSLGTLLIASSPSGAEVLIDGQDRGRTPATVRLPVGPHRLTVVLNGDLKAEQTVLVEGDQIVTRTIRW